MSDLVFKIRYTDGRHQLVPANHGWCEYILGSQSANNSDTCSIFIDDKHVSRRHCRIVLAPDQREFIIEDLGSSNGSYIADTIVVQPTSIPLNTEIRIGTTCITLCHLADCAPADLPQNKNNSPELMPPDIAKPHHESVPNSNTARLNSTTASLNFVGEKAQLSKEISESKSITPASLAPGISDQQPKKVFITKDTPPPNLSADQPFTRPKVTVHTDSFPSLADDYMGVDDSIIPAENRSDQPADELSKSAALPLAHRPRGQDRRSRHQGLFRGTERRSGVTRRTVGGALVFSEARNNPFFQRLLHANLLDARDIRSIFGKAQSQGHTALFMLANETSIRFWPEIYLLLAEYSKLALLDQEEDLMHRAIETNWFSFSKAIDQGAVLLTGGNPGRTLCGTVDPWNLSVDDWICRCSGQPVDKIIVQGDIFIKAIRQLKANASRQQGGDSDVVLDLSIEQEEVMRENLNDTNVPQLVNYVLHRALLQRASDIHIEPSDDVLIVRNRVDGYLHNELSLPAPIHSEIASRIKILAGMDVAEKRRPLDGRFGISSSSRNFDVRVSTFPTVYGEKFVLRLLDQNAVVGSLESLGLLPKDLILLRDRINAPLGLILISGPTGSGKTTTLYSCLGSLDATGKNIVTVEDPVEYRMKGVHQMQINTKLGLTFASGLRTILRQDPDVIMVGECRDSETAGMAVQSSLTGHVVFSTIHSNDAVGVISRLLNMEIEPFMVASALSVTMAQRLVRIICPHCKIEVLGETVLSQLKSGSVSQQRLHQLGIEVEPMQKYAQGAGCKQCRDTGYKGRRAVFEIYPINATVRSIIIQPEFDVEDLRSYAQKQGLTTLLSHGLQLVKEDVTTFEEIIRVMGEKY